MPALPLNAFTPWARPMLDLLKRMVAIESPTQEKVAVDQVGAMLQHELRILSADVTVSPQTTAGDHLIARWGEGSGGLLVICHMDTVWDMGTLAHMPLEERDGRLYGPGVLDMKAGIAVLLSALGVLREQQRWPQHPLTALFTSDEETGSATSQDLIESLARSSALTLCLEPALSNGALKTARKGCGDMELVARGRAAHAGIDHIQGRNAIEELAHHILAVQQLTDYSQGTTVNVGVVTGGTRSNVVPNEARAQVDYRVETPSEAARLEAWGRSLRPVLEGTAITANVVLNRPPMPRNGMMIATFEKASRIAAQIGLQLSEGSTGGGSDANFVSPLGVPVLDGLGGIGDGAHATHEHVCIASLPERAALLAALLTEWEI